jgi:transcriptional regulator with XRE-family HTH domain
MLGMSQTTLGNAVGVTFQQMQKYEKGSNRISSSRLSQIADVLKVVPTFFFEDALGKKRSNLDGGSAEAITNFLATPDGLSLAHSFSKLREAKLRHMIVLLVEEIANN